MGRDTHRIVVVEAAQVNPPRRQRRGEKLGSTVREGRFRDALSVSFPAPLLGCDPLEPLRVPGLHPGLCSLGPSGRETRDRPYSARGRSPRVSPWAVFPRPFRPRNAGSPILGAVGVPGFHPGLCASGPLGLGESIQPGSGVSFAPPVAKGGSRPGSQQSHPATHLPHRRFVHCRSRNDRHTRYDRYEDVPRKK